jgi:hypothetical protein
VGVIVRALAVLLVLGATYGDGEVSWTRSARTSDENGKALEASIPAGSVVTVLGPGSRSWVVRVRVDRVMAVAPSLRTGPIVTEGSEVWTWKTYVKSGDQGDYDAYLDEQVDVISQYRPQILRGLESYNRWRRRRAAPRDYSGDLLEFARAQDQVPVYRDLVVMASLLRRRGVRIDVPPFTEAQLGPRPSALVQVPRRFPGDLTYGCKNRPALVDLAPPTDTRVLDLSVKNAPPAAVFDLIAATPIGREILRRMEKSTARILPLTDEVRKHLQETRGWNPLALYEATEDVVYLDYGGELGLLAAYAVHEMEHATNPVFRNSRVQDKRLAVVKKIKDELGIDVGAVDTSTLTREQTQKVQKIASSFFDAQDVLTFWAERASHDIEHAFVEDLVDLNPGYGPYLRTDCGRIRCIGLFGSDFRNGTSPATTWWHPWQRDSGRMAAGQSPFSPSLSSSRGPRSGLWV